LLEKLWGFARGVQISLKDDLLLAENKYGETALHIASHCDYEEISEKLWFWAREVHLNVSDDLLARDNNGQTACCINKYKSGG
jgi:ankyrin repeat protein